MPDWGTMLRDVPAGPGQLARHLDVSTRTIERYTSAGQAPRAVMLALFWETRWGISQADTDAANQAARFYMLAQSLKRENAQLRQSLERLQRQADFGCANAPLWQA